MAKRRKRLTRDHLGRFRAGTSVTHLRRAKRRIGGRRRIDEVGVEDRGRGCTNIWQKLDPHVCILVANPAWL